MGTRSHTSIIETSTDETGKQRRDLLVKIYRQYDGYYSGMGKELATWLDKVSVVNGFGSNDPVDQIICNVAGCLAAQLIKHVKDGIGNVYITNPRANSSGLNYEYDILVDFNTQRITLKAYSIVGYYNKNKEYCDRKKKEFEGSPADFLNVFLKKEAEKV